MLRRGTQQMNPPTRLDAAGPGAPVVNSHVSTSTFFRHNAAGLTWPRELLLLAIICGLSQGLPTVGSHSQLPTWAITRRSRSVGSKIIVGFASRAGLVGTTVLVVWKDAAKKEYTSDEWMAIIPLGRFLDRVEISTVHAQQHSRILPSFYDDQDQYP